MATLCGCVRWVCLKIRADLTSISDHSGHSVICRCEADPMEWRLAGDAILTRVLSGLPIREPITTETAELFLRAYAYLLAIDVNVPAALKILRRLVDELEKVEADGSR